MGITLERGHLAELRARQLVCYPLQVCVPDTQQSQANLNVRVWSRERFIATPRFMPGECVSRAPKTHQLLEGVQQSIFKDGGGKDGRVCDQFLHHF